MEAPSPILRLRCGTSTLVIASRAAGSNDPTAFLDSEEAVRVRLIQALSDQASREALRRFWAPWQLDTNRITYRADRNLADRVALMAVHGPLAAFVEHTDALRSPGESAKTAAIPNFGYFEKASLQSTFLRARGFDNDGGRSGGISDPARVTVAKGSALFRLYHEPKYRVGEWWFTPYEMKMVANHFGRGGQAFSVSRGQGKGILHAVLAVRHDWAENSPSHLGQFIVVRLAEPLHAFYGEADDAPDRQHTRVQKAVRIFDSKGRHRPVRQLFLPEPWKYASAFTELANYSTDGELLHCVERYWQAPMPFEI